MGSGRRLVLFSGGGTVGHLAPGFALAEALETRGIATRFATPGEAVEAVWFEGRTPPWTLPATRLPRSAVAAAAFPVRLARGVWRARTLLRRQDVGCLVALGGWPCAPAAWAARHARVPLVFLVPDAVPGLVVRKLARRAARLYLATDEARRALGDHPGVRISGPLLRREALAGARNPAAFGLHEDRATLLVTGGSLGAARLYERFFAGLEAALAAQAPSPGARSRGLAARIQIIHAEGRQAGDAAARYARLGIAHHVTPFLHAMGTAYRTADLVLCRAGASTCAELRAAAAPAVLVPYPHHDDRQQFRNAAPLVACGGAHLIEQEAMTPEVVARDVLGLLEDGEALGRMRAALQGDSRDAAGEAADDLIRFLGWEA